jgi:hypothetical protein
MTPKEKAQDIVNSMMRTGNPYHTECICFEIAKRCTLIAVEIRLESYFAYASIKHGDLSLEYWQQVKHEIEAL